MSSPTKSVTTFRSCSELPTKWPPRGATRQEANRLSVRLELQADFLAGVWAKRAEQRLFVDARDIDEALNCAQAIGDDRLQQETRGRIVPDSFTHGTSEQR